jgi:hypothetical protein
MSFFTDREGVGAREPRAPVLSIAALAELGVTHTDKRKNRKKRIDRVVHFFRPILFATAQAKEEKGQ